MTKSRLAFLVLAICAATGTLRAANPLPLFSANFDDLADGTTITGSNTAFAIIRATAVAGSAFDAPNPGFDGVGASMNILGVATGSVAHEYGLTLAALLGGIVVPLRCGARRADP